MKFIDLGARSRENLPRCRDERDVWRGHPIFLQYLQDEPGPYNVPDFREYVRTKHPRQRPFPQYQDGEWHSKGIDWVADLAKEVK